MGEIRSKRCEGRQLTKDQLVDELVRHPLLHPLVDSLDADYAAAGNLPAGRTEPTQPTPVTSQERGGGWVRGSVDFVPIAGGTDDPSPEAAGTEPPPTPANAAAGRRRGGGGGRRAAARSIGALTEVGDSMQSLPKTPGGEHGASRRRFSLGCVAHTDGAVFAGVAAMGSASPEWGSLIHSAADHHHHHHQQEQQEEGQGAGKKRPGELEVAGQPARDDGGRRTPGAALRAEVPPRPACGATCVTVLGLVGR